MSVDTETPARTDKDSRARSTDHVVGERIRHLRQARGMAIKDLATGAGLSIALISQIERGISSASVRVLAKLADGLDVAISDLFEPALDDASADRIVARVGERRRIDLDRTGIHKELLTPFSRQPRLDLYMMTIEPDGSSSDEAFVHQGEEAGVVLEGGIELFVDGRRYVLGEGDSFRFASNRPHRYLNAGRKTAKVIWTLYRESVE
ncbi:helix-turn-helix domain-containing protein [Nitratireductor soli]|uniref:helix-turn-helix domain-containing protein n=1 Tax=Nitratireductor soli TaxID=1670619 RepID=UPI00065E7152|nr:XRE family transcriptional regulator [Nitratireductor soli]